MKKLIIFSIALLAIGYWLVASGYAHAVEVNLAEELGKGITSPEMAVTDESIAAYIVRLYVFAAGAAGIVAVVVIVGGAIYYMTSSGSPDKQNDAKSYITSALWGVALLLGSYLILNTVNPQITGLVPPGGGLRDCDGRAGERPGIDCLPKPEKPDTESLEKNIAVACSNVWTSCGFTYPEKPGFRATFEEEVKGPFFNCPSDDSCKKDVETRFATVKATEAEPVTLVAYPFYKTFDSEFEPDKKVVRVRCAATHAVQKGEPFVPKDVSIAEKAVTTFLDFFRSGRETDYTQTLTACKDPAIYKKEGLLPP